MSMSWRAHSVEIVESVFIRRLDVEGMLIQRGFFVVVVVFFLFFVFFFVFSMCCVPPGELQRLRFKIY